MKFVSQLIIAAALLGGVGWICSMAFPLSVFGRIIAMLGILSLCLSCVVCGVITGFSCLKGSHIHRVKDGQEKILIRLVAGPLSYTVEVPQEEEKSCSRN